MAEAFAPVCFMPSSTVAKTGFPRCSVPAFLGLVPPTTFVPRVWRQLGSWRLLGRVQGRAHTVFDGLLGVEAVPLSAQSTAHSSCTDATHVPCLPVKPWNSTFVSPLMRRFLMVSE